MYVLFFPIGDADQSLLVLMYYRLSMHLDQNVSIRESKQILTRWACRT